MIVACPACQSRYDVSGRPPGTSARCRCGHIFTLPEPPTQAAQLNCPRCGGNVAPTNHRCEYCAAELLVKACPRCFARVFHDSKHCAQCGTEVVVPARARLDGTAIARVCPRCKAALVGRLLDEIMLDECSQCHGVFVDVTALDRIVYKRGLPGADSLLGPHDRRPAAVGAAFQSDGPLYVSCPDCEQLMNRRSFAPGSAIIVDVCRAHGTWFDANELPSVIAFISRGGTVPATQSEALRRAKPAQAIRMEALASANRRDDVGVFASLIETVIDHLLK